MNLPLLIAPAMNVEMWQNAATRRNADQIRADRISILGPDAGEQACGEIGQHEIRIMIQQRVNQRRKKIGFFR